MSKSTKTAAAAPKSNAKNTNAKAAAPTKKTAAPAAAKKSAPKAPKAAAATAQNEVISGTTPELIAGVLLNGVPLEGPYLSMMLKYGIVHKVGEVKSNPGGRGKAANIIEVRSNETLKFTRAAAATLA